MKSRATILLSGMVAAQPGQGGATWAVMQYLLGFRQLGHETYFIEPVARTAIRPAGSSLADSENAKYISKVMADFDFEGYWALLLDDTRETIGMTYDQVTRLAQRTDVLVNISGMLTDQNLLGRIPCRVYLDLDPAFNQLWSAVEGLDMRFEGHTHFVTIGQSIGEPICSVPTCGRSWVKTWQPVVLERWPVTNHAKDQALTTIANWRGYGSIPYQGVLYGQKAHSLRQFFALPTLCAERLLLALSIHPDETADLAALTQNGWHWVDPCDVADTPCKYQTFIQNSKAELGIAKSGYVLSRCGWFSDRSVCYLASGRPVLAQDTGFARYLPAGEGLFAFNDTAELLNAVNLLNADYARHAAQARALAEEYFDSSKVLTRLLDRVVV